MPSPSQPPPDVSFDDTAAECFTRRTRTIAALLTHRLDATLSLHDLTLRRLRAAHRNIAELDRQGRAPTPTEFWEQTAYPEARRLLNEATQIIDAERVEFTKALQQFATAVGERRRPGAGTGVSGPPILGSGPVPEADIAIADRAIAAHAIATFGEAAGAGAGINEVGAWWQSKLRRRAILATCGRLLLTPIGHYELEVSAAEMSLLDRAPWSHDDRMLSAFELAHSNLREHVTNVKAELSRQAKVMMESVHATDGTSPRSEKQFRAARTHAIETIELR